MPSQPNRQVQAGGPDLDQYLRAPRPGSWLILIVTLVLLAMVLTWAFLGTMKTTVPVTGIKDAAHFTGYLRPADTLSFAPGMPVEHNGEPVGVLTGRGTVAYSASEVAAAIDNAYFSGQLALSPLNVEVTADLDPAACPDGVLTLEVVVAEVRPFDFFMG